MLRVSKPAFFITACPCSEMGNYFILTVWRISFQSLGMRRLLTRTVDIDERRVDVRAEYAYVAAFSRLAYLQWCWDFAEACEPT